LKVSLIAAVARNGTIGIANRLPWRLPADLRRFKALTLGHHLVMGRKTFESVGALPGRVTIVVSRRGLGPTPPAGVRVASSVPEALDLARRAGETEAFVAGGAEIYAAALDFADRIYLTRIDRSFAGDATFPEIDAEEWEEVESQRCEPDDRNPHRYTFVRLERRAGAGFG
jgi:dihydrofolate reductase